MIATACWLALFPLGIHEIEPSPLAREVLVAVDAEGTPWVRGADYKAGFGPAGPVFVPFLGADAPRDEPLALRLRAARVGGLELPLALEAPARVEANEHVVYERGALTERYRIDPRGIEQMFRVDALPAAGPLTLTVGFETALAPLVDAAGIGFLGERGGARYGAAVALDATGRTVEVPVRLLEDALELEVPADFLAGARYPVLVDPLIATFALDAGPDDDREPDVAYDASLDLYVAVWERAFSLTDVDVHGRVLDAAGNVLDDFAIDVSPQSYREVRIAGAEALDRFLVTALRDGLSRVDCRLVDVSAGGSASVGPLFTALQNCEHHELGGGASFCLAAGTVFAGIRYLDVQLIAADGQLGPFFYFGESDAEAWRPFVSPIAGGPADAPAAWALAYDSYFVGLADGVRQVRVRADGTWTDEGAAGGSATAKAVGVSSMLDAATGAPVDLVLSRTPDGVEPIALFARLKRGVQTGPPVAVGPTPGWNYEEAAVDCDGSSFVVSYTERAPGATRRTVHAATYNVEGSQLVLVERQLLSGLDGMRGAPSVFAQRSGGGAPQRFVAAWHDLAPPDGDLELAIYDSPGPGRVYCDGAPNSVGPGARVSASGSISLALESFSLHVDGCPPNRPGLFYLGETEVQLPFGEGFRCIGGATARISPTLTTDGAGAASQTLDFDAPYGALVAPGSPGINYQFWYRDPAGGPATFNLSDALHVEHTP